MGQQLSALQKGSYMPRKYGLQQKLVSSNPLTLSPVLWVCAVTTLHLWTTKSPATQWDLEVWFLLPKVLPISEGPTHQMSTATAHASHCNAIQLPESPVWEKNLYSKNQLNMYIILPDFCPESQCQTNAGGKRDVKRDSKCPSVPSGCTAQALGPDSISKEMTIIIFSTYRCRSTFLLQRCEKLVYSALSRAVPEGLNSHFIQADVKTASDGKPSIFSNFTGALIPINSNGKTWIKNLITFKISRKASGTKLCLADFIFNIMTVYIC